MLSYLRDFSLGQYIPGNSYLHHLDARMKVILMFIFIANVFVVKTIFLYLLLFLFISDLILLARLRFYHFIRGLRAVLFLVIFVTLMNLLFITDGKVIFSFWILKITDQGLSQTLIVISRLLLLVMTTTLLTLTTSPVDLTYALEKLGKPLKKIGFPVHEFALMTTIALRFIPILARELDKIIKAQIARGINFGKGNFIVRLRKVSSLLLPLFFNSFKRADELSLAMEVRCYTGGEGRTSLREYRLKTIDFAALLLFVSLFVSCKLGLLIIWMS
ncbi:MAG: energy-coupling factor transporter transmembrane component T [Candidatus Wallbacteria bacterium]|nr:energy-coupling factor transporter transmembrane component T [Candidatus Wallbacteria bacterium]